MNVIITLNAIITFIHFHSNPMIAFIHFLTAFQKQILILSSTEKRVEKTRGSRVFFDQVFGYLMKLFFECVK